MKQTLLLLFAAFVFSLVQPSARADDAGDAILGLWHTVDDKSIVKISKRHNQYFGQIVSLTLPNFPDDDKFGMAGKPRTDRNNPDPTLRNRLLAGIEIATGFTYAGKNLWENGKIYDPESGNTYRSKITLRPDNHLELRGFIGISLIGRTVVWTR
jgi:uncharacterized protein (DUF2147 family)